MTHRRDNQSIDDAFDRAVHEMHQGMARGERPSSNVWNTIAQQAGIDSQTPEGSLPKSSRKSASVAGVQPVIHGVTGQRRPASYLNWSTWLAAALVVVLIGASMNFLIQDGKNANPPPTNSIALAPGTPDVSSLVAETIASPVASPDYNEYIPVHGPEFACTADPMTEEEVFQIVLNPGNGWKAKDPNFNLNEVTWNSGLYESPYSWANKTLEREASNGYIASDEQVVTGPIIETANMFWNCLMTGSAFQVWSMMDPFAIQREVLMQYPVLRDEAILRNHIAKWGPRKYSASIYHEFPDFGNTEPYRASMHVEGSYGSIRIGYSQGIPWKALVLMAGHPQADSYWEHYLLLTIAPDGTWWVSAIFYE